MKSFGPKAWVLPQPVLVIGTYNTEGKANAMNAAWSGQWDNEQIMISMERRFMTGAYTGYRDMTGEEYVVK